MTSSENTRANRSFMALVVGFTSIVLSVSLMAEDAQAVKQMAEKGAIVTELKGGGLSVTIKDCAKFSADDFGVVGKLPHVKTLSLGMGFNDASAALLSGLTEVETLSTNGMQVSDDGMKAFDEYKNLKNVAIFHPGQAFTGTGLSHFAGATKLESLTVAGSATFADAGMAAVGKLTQLKSFRTWHSGLTKEGVAELKSLKDLKSLNLGQRLANKPPVSVSDDVVATLAELHTLESLQLGEARLSLMSLSLLKQLPALKKLTLDGIELPKADVEQLKKDLPKVEIKWIEPNEAAMKRIHALFDPKDAK